MGYTSSEAVAVVTRNQGAELRDHPTSAGRLNITTELEIRDENGNPVPDGVDGEIHVRSPYLMLGYWGDDEATQAVLQAGPMAGDGRHRLHARRTALHQFARHAT